MTLVALIVLFIAASPDSVTLVARIAPDSLYVDEAATATIAVQSFGHEIIYRAIERLDLQDLQSIGSQHTHARENRDGIPVSIDIFTFTLKPTTIGMCYLQPQRLLFHFAGETDEFALLTPPLSVLARNRPMPNRMPWMLAGIFALGVALAGAGAKIARRLRNRDASEAMTDQRAILVPQAVTKLSEWKLDASPESARMLFSIVRDFVREYYGTNGSADAGMSCTGSSGDPMAIPTVGALRDFLNARGATEINDTLDALERAMFGREATAAELETLRMRLKNFIREFNEAGQSGKGEVNESGN